MRAPQVTVGLFLWRLDRKPWSELQSSNTGRKHKISVMSEMMP